MSKRYAQTWRKTAESEDDTVLGGCCSACFRLAYGSYTSIEKHAAYRHYVVRCPSFKCYGSFLDWIARTTYVDAVYCCLPSSVVCQSLTLVSLAKTAEPIEILFGLRTWVAQGTMYQTGVQIPRGKGQLWGKGAPIVQYRDFVP